MTKIESSESASVPKYISVYNDLRKGIVAGQYGSDGRMPTEKELMDQFGVSRTTIRRATNLLRRDNLIESRQGRGTDVSLGNLYQNQGQQNRLTEIMHVDFDFLTEGPEITKHSDILCDEIAAKPEVAKALDIPSGEIVYRLRWLHTINDLPYLYLVNYLRKDLTPDLPDHVGGISSLYPVLMKEYDLKFVRADEAVEPVIADFILAKILEIPSGTPLIKLFRSAVFSKGPAECSESFIRSDLMKISFRIE